MNASQKHFSLVCLQVVNNISVALLVVEGCVLSMSALMYMNHLISGVAMQRYSVFSVFLSIPGGFLRTLATKSCAVSWPPYK